MALPHLLIPISCRGIYDIYDIYAHPCRQLNKAARPVHGKEDVIHIQCTTNGDVPTKSCTCIVPTLPDCHNSLHTLVGWQVKPQFINRAHAVRRGRGASYLPKSSGHLLSASDIFYVSACR